MNRSTAATRGRWRLFGSRRRSPVTSRRFWLAIALLTAAALWHDGGSPVWRQATAQPTASTESTGNGNEPEEADVRDESNGTDTPPADAATVPHAAETDTEAATHADGHAAGHADPVAPVLAAIVLILLLAKVGGDLFERMRLPAVLGELVLGILLGNFLLLTGSEAFEFMQPPEAAPAVTAEITVGEALKILAGIGVVLLLFEVGLESTVREMFSVGASSLTVAVVGVVVPIALGYVVTRMFFFDSWQAPIFIGATLCATSVGITARVLKDLHRGTDEESRIILGAAVLDDVLGLIVLAVASGVIVAAGSGDVSAANFPWGDVGRTVFWAFAFLGGALLLGAAGFPRFAFRLVGYLHGHGLLIATALVICFGMAYLANLVGLATIVGAFAAGLILEPAHYKDLAQREHVELEESLHPLTALLVPVFFVQTGMGVKLDAMADPSTWMLASALTVIAVIGKMACSLAVVQRGLNRTAIGLGMVPRGEVGLIFADQGRRLSSGGEPVIDDATFSTIVFMVMVTTLIAPPLLRLSLKYGGDSQHAPGSDPEI